jgi:hypothetical protein
MTEPAQLIKVVLFTSAFDTGGQGWRIKRAFDRYCPDFLVRSIHTDESYFAYPHDLRYRAGPEFSYKLTEEADVLHFRNSFGGLKRLRASGKPVGLVLHHHGTKFRQEHETLSRDARERGAIQLASTIDLAILEPDVAWLPAPFDLVELAALRTAAVQASWSAAGTAPQAQPRPIRVAHAPTNRSVKSTLVVMKAVGLLAEAGLPIVLDLIERTPYAVCLARKAKADILIDQLELGYGNSAIEAWGMGIPVIAGVSSSAARNAMKAAWRDLPFYEATETSLVQRLAELATDSTLRSHWGAVGLAHAQKFHDEGTVAKQLAVVYRLAMERVGVS